MVTALTRFKPQTRPNDSTFTSLDAKAIACESDSSVLYTSPNMSFIPEPHNKEEELRARADGRFATADCFQWPQLYCKEFEYAVCIPRREHHPFPDPLVWAWYTPTLEDFDVLPIATFAVGKLREEKALCIASLYQTISKRYTAWKKNRGDKQDIVARMLQSLQHTVNVLQRHPLTFRDVIAFVAQAQRTFFDMYAFLDYVEIVQPRLAFPAAAPRPVRQDWMGCFTQDSTLCNDLFHAGVPVWFTRLDFTVTNQTIIERPVTFTLPDGIIHAMYSEPGKSVRPFDLLYCGPGGFNRHLHTRRPYAGTTHANAVTDPSPQRTSDVGKAPTQAQSKKSRQKEHARTQRSGGSGGRDKWEDLRVPEMPLPLRAWESAMKRVDKNSSRVKKGLVDPGYRVPEPALLITCQTPERRQQYMTNWLAVRHLWISRLDHDPPPHFPPAQLWREFLNSVPSKEDLQSSVDTGKKNLSKSRKLAALEIFGEDARALTQGSSRAPKESVEWREKVISIASLSNPPPHLIRAILWELYEIGFRYELYALDRVVVPQLWAKHPVERRQLLYCVFPGSSGLVLWSEPLPRKPGDLGITDAFPSNVGLLYSFCLLLSAWPGAHPSLSSFASALSVAKDEQKVETCKVISRACLFYVQTFFDHFGRPPLLPHAFPFEYHD